jgi:hypothetical protein
MIDNTIESHNERRKIIYKMPVSVQTANLMTTTTTDAKINNNIKTFRFEFSKGFIDELSRFSKVHQFDERRAYKEAWQKWKSNQEIDEIISFEIRRLEEIGYKGDIEDKMFKSGRYYFRKKSINGDAKLTSPKHADQKDDNTIVTADQEKQEHDDDTKNKYRNDRNDREDDGQDSSEQSPHSQDHEEDEEEEQEQSQSTTAGTTEKKKQQRRPYITMSKTCIRLMDSHITEFSKLPEFKPSTSYDNFYQEMMSTPQMMQEIENIIAKYEKTMNKTSESLEAIMHDIMDKIKKTYKNRYYRFVNRK